MARLVFTRDERGAVYVEFLIAFFPLFLLFLGICQVALIATAETIVRHAAYSGVRTAIIVLDDASGNYKAEPGSLSKGNPSNMQGIDDVAAKLGIPKVSVPKTNVTTNSSFFGHIVRAVAVATMTQPNAPTTSGLNLFGLTTNATAVPSEPQSPQQGSRMVPIQTAAMLPLLPLAPSEGLTREQNESIAGALNASSLHQLGFAVEYTKSAALVTVHDSPDNESLAFEPIGVDAPVTVRVTYLFHCTIPIVRSMMCGTLQGLARKGELIGTVAFSAMGIMRPDARFKVLTAVATLPNQGAAYQREASK